MLTCHAVVVRAIVTVRQPQPPAFAHKSTRRMECPPDGPGASPFVESLQRALQCGSAIPYSIRKSTSFLVDSISLSLSLPLTRYVTVCNLHQSSHHMTSHASSCTQYIQPAGPETVDRGNGSRSSSASSRVAHLFSCFRQSESTSRPNKKKKKQIECMFKNSWMRMWSSKEGMR